MGASGHVRAQVPLPRKAPLFESHQAVPVQSPLARWPRVPSPRPARRSRRCARSAPARPRRHPPGSLRRPRGAKRPDGEDQARSAMTGSNPRAGRARSGQRPRSPTAAGSGPGRPITLSPSNAHSRAAIGPARTSPAPNWPWKRNEPRPRPAPLNPDAGSSVCPPRGPSGPQCSPGVTPLRVTQTRPFPLRPHAARTWPPRPRRPGPGAPRALGAGSGNLRPCGAPRPGAPPGRAPAEGRGARHHPTGGGAPGPGAQPRRSLAWAAQPSCQPMWRVRAGTAAVK